MPRTLSINLSFDGVVSFIVLFSFITGTGTAPATGPKTSLPRYELTVIPETKIIVPYLSDHGEYVICGDNIIYVGRDPRFPTPQIPKVVPTPPSRFVPPIVYDLSGVDSGALKCPLKMSRDHSGYTTSLQSQKTTSHVAESWRRRSRSKSGL